MHRVLSAGRLLGMAGACLVLWTGAASGQEIVEVSGTLHTTWIDDGVGGSERQIPTLVADDGQVYLLEVSPAQLERHGGLLTLNRGRVTLRVRRLALVEASQDPGRRLAVDAIESAARPAGTGVGGHHLVAAGAQATGEPTPLSYLTLLCKYPDSSGEPTPSSYYAEITSMAFPNAGHYWTEASGGALTMEGSQLRGWYTLPRPESDYDVVGSSFHDTALLLDDCMAAADPDVHFPDFSGINVQVDGLIGDYFNLNGYATVGYSSRDGVGKSYAVTIMSQTANLGTYIHEIGHTLGLPHSSGPYGQTYDSRWDVMSGGRWAAGGDDHTGVRTIAYHLDRLGWIPAGQRLVAPAGEATVLLMPGSGEMSGSDPRLVVIPLPAGDFYTVETRRREGYDGGIPSEGVLIHHVRSSQLEPARVVDVDGNGEVNDAGAVWVVGETFRDRDRQVEVSVDGEVGRAFRVTVRVAAMDSLHLLAAPHHHEVPFGWTGEIRDSAYVRTAGPNAATIPWTVIAHGLILDTPSGVGSGWIRWRTRVEHMAEGEYAYSLGVETDGVENGPVYVNPTLRVGAPTELSGAFAGAAARSWAMADRDVTSFMEYLPTLRIGGAGASETKWNVVRMPTWMQLSPDSGTGDGYLWVSRSAAGMAAGTYTDTIVVSIEGATQPAILVDHLEVVGPVQIVPHWAPSAPRVAQEAAPVPDSVYVEVTGPRAEEVHVSAAGTGPLYASGPSSTVTGSGWIRFTWTPGTNLPGAYPVQLRLQTTLDQGNSVVVHDTLHVVAAPPALVVSSTVIRDTAFVGEWSEGAVYVQPEGAGAATRPWRPVQGFSSAGRLFLLDDLNATLDMAPNAPRPGARWVRWVRSMSDRPAGAGADSIMIAYEDEPRAMVVVIDSVWVVRTEPPRSVAITSDSVRPAATMGSVYQDTLHATNETDSVRWSIVDGVVPTGIALDSITGVLSGIPELTGPHRFTAAARSGDAADTRSFRIDVVAPTLAATAVLDHLLGGEILPDSLARYLDLLGNHNGRVDVGDVHAWLLEADAARMSISGDTDDAVALRDFLSTTRTDSTTRPEAGGHH